MHSTAADQCWVTESWNTRSSVTKTNLLVRLYSCYWSEISITQPSITHSLCLQGSDVLFAVRKRLLLSCTWLSTCFHPTSLQLDGIGGAITAGQQRLNGPPSNYYPMGGECPPGCQTLFFFQTVPVFLFEHLPAEMKQPQASGVWAPWQTLLIPQEKLIYSSK